MSMTTTGFQSLAELRDQIRRILESPASPASETVSELAMAYSEASDRVNTRLSRAKEWLRRGLRSEALHWVEQHPDALETASHLDLFDQFKDWHMLCMQHGVERVVGPDLDAAAELSAAYEMERKLETRLKQHRILALMRGSTRDRLEVLRRLAAIDEGNQNWETQIVSMETARLAEIKAEAVHALQVRDDTAIQAMANELDPSDWRNDQVRRLRDKLTAHGRDLCAELGGEALTALLPRLHEAHAGQEEERCRNLAMEWEDTCNRTGAVPLPEQHAEFEAIRSWLLGLETDRHAQAEFERGLASLTQSLDDEAKLEEVERQYSRLAATERPLPESLERRVNFRVRQVQTSRRNAHRLTALTIILLLVGSGVFVWWLIQSINTNRQIQEWTQRLDATLTAEEKSRSDRIEVANRMMNDIERTPRIAKTSSIAALRIQISDMEREENERSSALEALLQQVSTISDTDPEGLRLLGDAMKLVDTTTERSRVESESQDRQDAIDAPFAARVESVRASMGQLPTENSRVERLAALESINNELVDILSDSQAVSSWRRSEVVSIQGRVRSMISEVRGREERTIRMAADLRRIPEESRTVSKLVEQLRSFVNTYPEQSSGSHRLNAALARASDWESLESWANGIHAWHTAGNNNLRLSDGQLATDRVRTVNQMIERHATSPLRSYLEEYSVYLSKAVELGDGLSSSELALLQFCHEPWMHDMRALLDDNKVFHFSMGGRIYADSIGVTITEHVGLWSDLHPDATRQRSGPIKFTRPHHSGSDRRQPTERDLAQQLVLAPHSISVRRIVAMLDEQPGWDVLYLKAAAIVQENEEIDPILRAWLIGQFLRQHERHNWGQIQSPSARKEISDFLQSVRGDVPGAGPFSELHWMSTSNTDAARGRVFANRLLGRLPNLSVLCVEIEEQWDRRTAQLAPMQMAGLIWPDGHGTAEVRTWGARSNTEVFVVISTAGRQSELVSVGRIRAGTFVADPSFDINIYQWGTPLFIRFE